MSKLVENVVNKIMKEAHVSIIAKIFDPGEIVVLVDQVQGLNKGLKYKVVDVKPGKIIIKDLPIIDEDDIEAEGKIIGEFDSDRFVRYNDEY